MYILVGLCHIRGMARRLAVLLWLALRGYGQTADNRIRLENENYSIHAIGCFGWDRVLFGSDWPVCTLAGGYEPWLEAALWATSGANESDRRKLFSENAKRVYRF